MSKFEKYLKDIEKLQLFGIKLGLDQTKQFFSLLGDPHKSLKFIHIAGSNGKGSTAAILNAALQHVGLKVGFYSSPHLINIRERFRINNKAISESKFNELYQKMVPKVEFLKKQKCCPTFFEFTTAFAAKYFAEQNVDIVIWETGLGGRLDATNVVDSYYSVITNIALEHQQYLGESIKLIAQEKAGIIKKSQKVFVGDLLPEALDVVTERCHKFSAFLIGFDDCQLTSKNCHIIEAFSPLNNCQVIKLSDKFPKVELGVLGEVQLLNARLAYNVLSHLADDLKFSLKDAIKGFAHAVWLGRLQILPDNNILDGAHNEAGISKLYESLSSMFGDRKYCVVFGCFLDKDYAESLKMLALLADKFYLVPVKNSMNREYVEPIQLKKYLLEMGFDNHKITVFDSVDEALNSATELPKLIVGSLFLQQYVLRHYYTEKEIINLKKR